MCSLVGTPASYLRQLPAPLAGINLQHGLLSHRAELVKTLEPSVNQRGRVAGPKIQVGGPVADWVEVMMGQAVAVLGRSMTL